MRRLFTIILCLMLLPAGSAMAMTATDEKDGQKTEQKDDNKKDCIKSLFEIIVSVIAGSVFFAMLILKSFIC